MTSFPVSSYQPRSAAVIPSGVPSVNIERDICLVGAKLGSMPWIIAYDGQNPFVFAKSAAGMGQEEGNAGDSESCHPLLTI